MALIEHDQTLDLAEADLHFCSSHGASCGGWWPDQALGQIQSRGIPDEAAFPYASAFEGAAPHCYLVTDRDARAVCITSFGSLADAAARKNHLSAAGPCSAVLHVFNDFFSYGAGIYHHVAGTEAGLHCVEVVGYSESDRCWICKNFWGWGDGGFFRIAYGECGIDTEFPFFFGTGVVLPTHRGWSGWVPLGAPAAGFIDAPAVASRNSAVCNIYVRGGDNALWQKGWFNNAWHDWRRHDRRRAGFGARARLDGLEPRARLHPRRQQSGLAEVVEWLTQIESRWTSRWAIPARFRSNATRQQAAPGRSCRCRPASRMCQLSRARVLGGHPAPQHWRRCACVPPRLASTKWCWRYAVPGKPLPCGRFGSTSEHAERPGTMAAELKSLVDAVHDARIGFGKAVQTIGMIYPVHARIRKSLGEMTRKLSDTASQ